MVVASTADMLGTVSSAYSTDIVIGLQNRPSASATAHIIKVAIEDNLGLEVELQNGTNPVIFEAMDKGSMDILPEVWLPNQQNLFDKYVTGNGSVMLNTTGMPASQGLCVPTNVAEFWRRWHGTDRSRGLGRSGFGVHRSGRWI